MSLLLLFYNEAKLVELINELFWSYYYYHYYYAMLKLLFTRLTSS